MSTSLSLYTSQILKEHPLAIWSFNDQIDYLSILSDDNRDLSLWTCTSSPIDNSSIVSVLTNSNPIDPPIVDQNIYTISHTAGTPDTIQKVRFTSNDISSLSSFDSSLATFSISTYLYSSTNLINSVSIGISYNDITYGTQDVSKKFLSSISDKWIFISETFDIPEGISENYRVFIEIEYLSNASLTTRLFSVCGYSVGQWAEEFNAKSVGVNSENLLQNIYSIPDNTMVIPVLGSLESTQNGYVLTDGYKLFARNFGMPLVYGSSSSTTLFPNNNLPSMILPGLGFLNNSGKNKNYSLEFWMRINPSNTIEKRILGPVGSLDGVYVEGPFLTLKIGKNSKSHFVGEWYRPMVVHIVISEHDVTMLVNGELVATIVVDRSTLDFPNEVIDGKQADWIGLYSYSDIDPFEINSVSIYSYLISSSIAKRRWIYGQAVDNPETLNTAYGGKSIYFDYEFSKYSNSYSYPKIGSWESGIKDNLEILGNKLGNQNYNLPIINSDTASQIEILQDSFNSYTSGDVYVSLPEGANLYFEKMNPIVDKLRSIHAVFSLVDQPIVDQCLLLIKDTKTSNELSVIITDSEIKYSLYYSGNKTIFASNNYVYSNNKFAIGLDLELLSKYFGNNVSNFLSNKNSLELFIAGAPDQNTFSGKIYSVSFSNDFSYNEISTEFYPNGLLINPDPETSEFVDTPILTNSQASYILKPYILDETVALDIRTSGSWTNNIPMTYFGKYIKNANGSLNYDLDFLQFNIGYPSPAKLIQVKETDDSWTYQELNLKFSQPVQKIYSDLDNPLYTGYTDYTDLQHNSRQTYKYDTSDSLVKTYIYFKEVSSGMSNSSRYYSNIVIPSQDAIVSPGDEWINTKYEVIDNTIIYPPKGVDFKTLSMFVEVKISIDRSSDRSIAIDKLQFASISLNNSYGTPIGTKYGIDVYPYSKNGFYYDFKSKNPFSIYKGSTPYLYLSKTSGIRVRGDLSSNASRGIQIPVNPEQSSNYRMIALQFFAKFDGDFFPYSPTEILDIKSSSSHIKIFMQATHPNGARAKIYAINAKTGQIENGLGFFVNGSLVKDGILTIKQWSSIGIGFSNFIDFSLSGGYVGITGPLTIDNLSHYNSIHLQQIQTTSARQWLKVKQDGQLSFDWSYWQGSFRWFEVLVLASTNFYGVDPAEIYKTYVGTSRVIVDDKTILRTNRYRYRLFSNAITNNFMISSV